MPVEIFDNIIKVVCDDDDLKEKIEPRNKVFVAAACLYVYGYTAVCV